MCVRIGDDEVRGCERPAVDPFERACRRRSGVEARTVADERVGEGDERVEDDRRVSCRASCRGQVEVAGVPDDDGIDAA
ncbi:MAG: hypothetical protein ACJ747_06885 [Gaiellaceae bacterium]